MRAQGKTRKGDSLLRHAGELRSASRARGRSSSFRRTDSWGSKEWEWEDDVAAPHHRLEDGGNLWGQEGGTPSTAVVNVNPINPIAVYE
eukprot:g16247.t1